MSNKVTYIRLKHTVWLEADLKEPTELSELLDDNGNLLVDKIDDKVDEDTWEYIYETLEECPKLSKDDITIECYDENLEIIKTD